MLESKKGVAPSIIGCAFNCTRLDSIINAWRNNRLIIVMRSQIFIVAYIVQQSP